MFWGLDELIDHATEFYNRVSGDISLADKFALLRNHALELGLTDIYYARRSFDADQKLVRNIFTEWDGAWAAEYDEAGYIDVDWVRQRVESGSQMFRFDDPVAVLSEAESKFVEATRRHGRMNGIGIPFRNGAIVPGGMTAIAANRPLLTDEQINRLCAAVGLFDLAVAVELAGRSAMQVGLTVREVKLIRLLSRGQTSVQISQLTGCSEQWIRRSFMIIREKLWVGNNVELVLRANALQLIE